MNNCDKCIYYSHCIHRQYYPQLEDSINEGLSNSSAPFICKIECTEYTTAIPVTYSGSFSEFMDIAIHEKKKLLKEKENDI